MTSGLVHADWGEEGTRRFRWVLCQLCTQESGLQFRGGTLPCPHSFHRDGVLGGQVPFKPPPKWGHMEWIRVLTKTDIADSSTHSLGEIGMQLMRLRTTCPYTSHQQVTPATSRIIILEMCGHLPPRNVSWRLGCFESSAETLYFILCSWCLGEGALHKLFPAEAELHCLFSAENEELWAAPWLMSVHAPLQEILQRAHTHLWGCWWCLIFLFFFLRTVVCAAWNPSRTLPPPDLLWSDLEQ